MERRVLKKLLTDVGEGDARKIDEALRDPKGRALSAEEAVVAAGAVSEWRLCEIEAGHLALPLVHLDGVQLDPQVVGLIDRETARNYCVIPYRVDADVLTLVMADPEDVVAEDVVRFLTRLTVRPIMGPRTEIVRAVEQYYTAPAPLARLLERLPPADDIEVFGGAPQDTEGDPAEIASVTRLLNSLITEAVRLRASDIHIEPSARSFRIRYGVDGLLQTVADLPHSLQRAVVRQLKAMGGLEVAHERRPQEGRARLTTAQGPVDLRVRTLPSLHGEQVVVSVLDHRRARLEAELLGLFPADRDRLCHILSLSQGLVLCAGPSGCGKTSTLYWTLSRRNAAEDNIITIEDEVEVDIPGVTQVPRLATDNPSIAALLKTVLGQNPNVVMLNELPDPETLKLALEAAQDGRLILSSVRTRDAVSAISRLMQMGGPEHLVGTSLACVMAQRLVRRLCPYCRMETPLSEAALDTLNYLHATRPARSFASRGCSECNYTGYRGRLGMFELLVITERLRELISRDATERELLAAARQDGMSTLLEDGLKKVALGWTSLEDVLRVAASEGPGGRRCSRCAQILDDAFQCCPRCSDGLTQTCPACGKGVEADWVTCPWCRISLKAGQPRRPEAPAVNEGVPTLDPPTPAPTSKEVILLVDDEPISASVVKSMLEDPGGYVVVTAGNGVEGLQMANSLRPDLILSDIHMPQMDGLEMVRRLRGQVRTALIPVILMTSQAEQQGEVSAFQAGADDYLRKPIAEDRVLARVAAVLRRQAPRC